ncbi:MAG TPA: hypothetical protein VJ770_00380 [Stellaceae bacterium]|nr:hypothetical protein [Stellaceae bacterium]
MARDLMTKIKTRIHIASDGTLTGRAEGLPVGEHEAEIQLVESSMETPAARDADALLARVRAIQAEVARLPVYDSRSPDEIVGYNERGHFD